MSEAPKFKTFKDLRSIPQPADKQGPEPVVSKNNPSLTSNTSKPSNASITSKPSKPSNTSKGANKLATSEVSPTRDFQKVPNSVTRQAVPQGLFKGKSKQVWDYLWSVSRGAINPTRTVRKSRPEIKKGSGLGSFVTVDASIKHLEDIGLIRKIEFSGSHDGNEFEIFTPEEAASLPSNTSKASNPSYTQNLGILVLPESSNTSKAQTPINIGSNDSLKHIDKTINTDDEAFAKFSLKMSEACERLTGKKPTAKEADKWEMLADLLILELEVAAKRTGGVSSVPAFLTEILRRQFFNASARSAKPSKPDTVGKSEAGDYEIKPLDEKGREAALTELREFADEPFLEDFKKWYTPEDWDWLTKELEKK